MFQNQGQEKQKQKIPELPDRPGFIGCSPWGTLIWVLLVVAIITLLWNRFKGGLSTPAQINYSAFRQQLSAGNIERVKVQGEEVQGELIEPAEKEIDATEVSTYTSFISYLPSFGDEELVRRLPSAGNIARRLPAR